jgi:hypothetical protein|tara:strand:- start:228 stop:1121 length:894 start_codon:yes stop_codon:yes gene_type:complete
MALSTMTNRTPGNSITAADWDIARNNILLITGTPSGTEGWGQSWSVYNPAAGATITDTNTNDMINAAQDIAVYAGATNTISDVSDGATIQETDLNNIQGTITNGYNSRLTADASYLSTENKDTSTRTAAWTTTVTHDCTVTFGSAAIRQAFFNAGGKLNFSASRSGGSSNDQNTDWTNMLAAIGTVQMAYTATTASSGTTTSIGNSDLTTSYQTIYTKAGSGSYSTNSYQIQAKAPTSSTLRFLITFGDSHTGRGYFDSVDGTLQSVIGQARPNSGTLPNGYTVTVATPTYATNTEL